MKNVLIVDDDIQIANLMKSYLEKKVGCEVSYCFNGHEAVKLMEKEHHAIDLIILDYNMPGMNGLEFMTYLKENNKLEGLNVVVSSSETPSILKKYFQGLPVKSFISKDEFFQPQYQSEIQGYLN